MPRIKESKCPRCGKTMDAATCVTRADWHPRPGDATICVYCSALLKFDEDLSLVPMPADELLAMPQEQLRIVMKAAIVAQGFRNVKASRN